MSDEERQKLKDAALKLKAEGNEFYLKDRNDDATRKYSEALEMCPLCFKKERAVFFANRAAAKCKMVSRKGKTFHLLFLRMYSLLTGHSGVCSRGLLERHRAKPDLR